MNKKFFIIIGAVLVCVSVALYGVMHFMFPRTVSAPKVAPPTLTEKVSSPKDATYSISGTSYKLVNGFFDREVIPNSVTREKIYIFGEPVYGDLDGDGDDDAVMFLAEDSGGSGTFYYVALAINNDGSYVGTNAMLLGDRIAPQTVEIHEGRAVANFADRKPGEPFSTQPSMGKSVWVHLDPNTGEIGELVKDFEGEVDVAHMSLGMKKWNWIRTESTDGKNVTPVKQNVFSLTFKPDMSVEVGTDCNSMGGSYTTNGNALTFGAMMSTMKYCDGSQESVFAQLLTDVGSYQFTSKGELILTTKDKKGTAIFR